MKSVILLLVIYLGSFGNYYVDAASAHKSIDKNGKRGIPPNIPGFGAQMAPMLCMGLDSDKDGSISIDDLLTMYKQYTMGKTEEEARASVCGFLAGVQINQKECLAQKTPEETAAMVFQKFDKDGDGLVSTNDCIKHLSGARKMPRPSVHKEL